MRRTSVPADAPCSLFTRRRPSTSSIATARSSSVRPRRSSSRASSASKASASGRSASGSILIVIGYPAETLRSGPPDAAGREHGEPRLVLVLFRRLLKRFGAWSFVRFLRAIRSAGGRTFLLGRLAAADRRPLTRRALLCQSL